MGLLPHQAHYLPQKAHYGLFWDQIQFQSAFFKLASYKSTSAKVKVEMALSLSIASVKPFLSWRTWASLSWISQAWAQLGSRSRAFSRPFFASSSLPIFSSNFT